MVRRCRGLEGQYSREMLSTQQTCSGMVVLQVVDRFVCMKQARAVVGGWFARNAEVLRQAGDVLLDPASRQEQPMGRWLTAADAFEQCDKATGQAIYQARRTPLP